MKKRMAVLGMILILVSSFTLVLVPTAASMVVAPIYVDDDASPGGDGSTWATAYNNLQDALDVAISGNQIWVAAGTYYPDITGSTDPRNAAFQMINGVGIYGGFAGAEDPATFNLANRDFITNETILSGDIGTPVDNTDNCYHVFYHPDGTWLDSTAILDGFTISDGNADESYPHNFGGGMYNETSSPMLANCKISRNHSVAGGGGMFNYGFTYNSNPILTNCTFSGNTAGSGGGVYNESGNFGNCHPTFTNCTFIDNNSVQGSGMANYSDVWGYTRPTITNCTFSGNHAVVAGGAIYNSIEAEESGCYSVLVNCILWGNTATSGGNEIFNNGGSTPQISYSDIQGSGGSGVSSWDTSLGTDLGKNIDANPLFYNPANGDFRLTGSSPCLDVGDNTALPPDTFDLDEDGDTTEPIPYDFEGGDRIMDGPDEDTDAEVDMGADEFPLSGGPAAPVPEVSAIVLLAIGLTALAGLCWLGRRRQGMSIA